MIAPPAISIDRHTSPLGDWLLGSWAPPALAGVVESMWYFEGRLAHRRERVFPRGRLELIVHFGERYAEVGNAGLDRYPRLCVTGQQLNAFIIEAPPAHNAVLGVQLGAAGAWVLFGRPLHETAGVTVALDDLVGDRARALADRCADVRSPHERMRAAAAWIAEQVAHGAVADPAVAWAARAIERSRGRVRIRSLEDEIGMARRTFTTRFREQVGLTPKRLARVTRFRNALARLHTGNEPLIDVALGCGYYDQPHFNAEFRAIAGCAPAEYRAAFRYPGSSSLAEPAD